MNWVENPNEIDNCIYMNVINNV